MVLSTAQPLTTNIYTKFSWKSQESTCVNTYLQWYNFIFFLISIQLCNCCIRNVLFLDGSWMIEETFYEMILELCSINFSNNRLFLQNPKKEKNTRIQWILKVFDKHRLLRQEQHSILKLCWRGNNNTCQVYKRYKIDDLVIQSMNFFQTLTSLLHPLQSPPKPI